MNYCLRMVKESFSDKVKFEQRHGRGEVSGGRIFWLEGTANANSLRREHAGLVLEKVGRPV